MAVLHLGFPSLQNQLMRHFSLGPSILALGRDFGEAGPLVNANSSCGQWHIRNVGQLTDLQEKDFVTQQLAHFVVIKQMKQLTACWSLVFSANKFGLLCYMPWLAGTCTTSWGKVLRGLVGVYKQQSFRSTAKRGELHHHSWLLVLMESSQSLCL